jgi:energy-coupling factor transport system ATP-binding protein
MIVFDNVEYSSGGREIIKNVSFHLRRGNFTALIGPNGAGKSTLSRLCGGLLKPTSGSVTTNGFDTRKTKTSCIARFTGFLFQNPDRQICKNSVKEEILFGLENIGCGKEEAEKRCLGVIERFGFDGDAAPFSLSRGERQRLALASVVALEPELLILDEPTTGLDAIERSKTMDAVRGLNRSGATVLMVSHDMELVAAYADEVMVLKDGRLEAQGPVRDILKNSGLLADASLLPPQMADLALQLGSGFEDVFTMDEMEAAIIRRHKSKEIQSSGQNHNACSSANI